MKLSRFLLFLLISLFARNATFAKSSAYDIYPVPEGVRQTEMFAVEVSADSLKWERVPVVMALAKRYSWLIVW